MAGWEPRVGERATQRQCIMGGIGLAEQRRLKQIQCRELFALAELWMVGHIVSGAGKSVEPEDRLTKAWAMRAEATGKFSSRSVFRGLEIGYARHRLG